MSNLSYKDYLIQEAFYGKLPEFGKIESLLDKIIKRVNKEGKSANPNKYPENKEIQKIFRKLFGFKKAFIYWEPFTYENAYTVPCNTLLLFSNKKKYIEKRKDKGFYDSSHSSVLTVYLSVGLITKSKLNPHEIVAVILHEIGHNFDYSAYHYIGYIVDLLCTLGLSSLEYSKNKNKEDELKLDTYKKIKKEDDKIYNDQKKRNKLNKDLDKMVEKNVKSAARLAPLTFIVNVLTSPITLAFGAVVQLLSLNSKKGELFADSFATCYGYGISLISGLEKISDNSKYYDPKSNTMKFLADLSTFQNEVLNGYLEIHGTNQERCKECLKKLKTDLKKNDFPPEMKEELVNEINRITKQYKDMKTFTPNEKLIITKTWRKIVNVVFRGSISIQKVFPTHKV